MKIVNIICSVILAITIPVTALMVGVNMGGRMPDVYSYELKATGVLEKLAVEEKEDQMGAFFSEYMMGKKETFQLTYLFGENTDDLFGAEEQSTMERYKNAVDKSLVVGVISLLLGLIAYFLLYKQNLKRLLRKSFLQGLPIYAILSLGVLVASLVSRFRQQIISLLFPYEIKSFMVLPQLLPESFFMHLWLVSLFISLIIMIFIWYFTWKITKPRRIFGASR